MSTERSPEEIYRTREDAAKAEARAELVARIDSQVAELESALRDFAVKVAKAGYPNGTLTTITMPGPLGGGTAERVLWVVTSNSTYEDYNARTPVFSVDAHGSIYTDGYAPVALSPWGIGQKRLQHFENGDYCLWSVGTVTDGVRKKIKSLDSPPVTAVKPASPAKKPRGWFARNFL